ncbi:MAG: hypothetical protein BJ554DRAFT_5732 [Olpidium bornovanus]|uniref:Uncharacterized protein n=1 Tax=Olpidium bornovanus TaxID=278681 RepID=A0A8H8DKK6_9FUNG|nr:MAG: hypothetical protein BJ554DRAFT_5732 [Olpidium bornovanus]
MRKLRDAEMRGTDKADAGKRTRRRARRSRLRKLGGERGGGERKLRYVNGRSKRRRGERCSRPYSWTANVGGRGLRSGTDRGKTKKRREGAGKRGESPCRSARDNREFVSLTTAGTTAIPLPCPEFGFPEAVFGVSTRIFARAVCSCNGAGATCAAPSKDMSGLITRLQTALHLPQRAKHALRQKIDSSNRRTRHIRRPIPQNPLASPPHHHRLPRLPRLPHCPTRRTSPVPYRSRSHTRRPRPGRRRC